VHFLVSFQKLVSGHRRRSLTYTGPPVLSQHIGVGAHTLEAAFSILARSGGVARWVGRVCTLINICTNSTRSVAVRKEPCLPVVAPLRGQPLLRTTPDQNRNATASPPLDLCGCLLLLVLPEGEGVRHLRSPSVLA
jgi:hypothetical protein